MGQFTGTTVEAAIEQGLEQLGLTRVEAKITVLSSGSKGFLGFFKKPAVVDITAIKVEKPKIKASTITEKSSPKPQVKAEKPKVVEEVEFSKPERNQPNIADAAEAVSDYVKTIIYEMDLDVNLVTNHNRRHIKIQIETSEPGRVIGYHGKVLKSLQLLAQNFLHDRYSKNFSVGLNVNDYMEYRTETLIDFTQRIANRVRETQKDYVMDPMTNGERKIVHKTITRLEGVTSYSEGRDPNRYVVVTPVD